jgi:RNA polymerase sigma-70 factor, ECF subfamily
MNNPRRPAVFMCEELRVVAERVIVSQAIPVPRAETEDRELELAVREHARLVYRIAHSVLRNHHDAEDATQETFLRVLRYRRKLEGVREQRTWLARIAWRTAVERRSKGNEIPFDEVSEMVTSIRSSPTPADQLLLGAEMSRVVGSLMATLPDKLRDPLTLSTLEEMTPADIGEVLGINEAAVRSRLFRARQIMREKLTALLEGKHGS